MRMKDSGIEWIGEIPQDWKICRTKFLCDISKMCIRDRAI